MRKKRWRGPSRNHPAQAWCVPNPLPPDTASPIRHHQGMSHNVHYSSHFSTIFIERVADRTVGARRREKKGGESRKQPALAWCVLNPQPPDTASPIRHNQGMSRSVDYLSHFSTIFSRTGRRARLGARKRWRGPPLVEPSASPRPTLPTSQTRHPDTTEGYDLPSTIRARRGRRSDGLKGRHAVGGMETTRAGLACGKKKKEQARAPLCLVFQLSLFSCACSVFEYPSV